MARLNTEIEGLALLQAKISALGDGQGTVRDLLPPLRKVGNVVKNRAKASAPQQNAPQVSHRTYKGRLVAPGFLKSSVRMRSGISKNKQSAYALIGVAPEAFYGLAFIELGTSMYPARPWMTPALEASADPAIQAVGQAWRKRIERIAAARQLPGYTPGSIRPNGLRPDRSGRLTGRTGRVI